MSVFSQSNISNIFGNQSNTNGFSMGTNIPNNPASAVFLNSGLGGQSSDPSTNQNLNPNSGTQNLSGQQGFINSGNTSSTTPMKINNSFGNSNLNQNNLFANNSQNIGNTTNTNSFNPFNNTNTPGIDKIFTTSNPNLYKDNSNPANKGINNMFNTNQNNEQKGDLFNQASQNPLNTASNNNVQNSIFNNNLLINSNTSLGNNQQTTNPTNTISNNSTFNPSQNNQETLGFNKNTISSHPTPNQSTLFSNQNQTNQSGSLFNTTGTNNPNSNTSRQNPSINPQTSPNIPNNLFGSLNQSTQQISQTNLINSNSLLTNPNNNQNKDEIKSTHTQPKNMFSIFNQTKPQDNQVNTTGGLFQSLNSGGLFGNQSKSDNSTTGGAFTSLLGGTTTNKSLFGDYSNTIKSAAENKPQFITAPSNILGINMDTLSENVKKAYKSENKSIKDFIREVEKDFYKEDHKEYYKKIPNDLYSTHVNVHNPLEDYHDRYKHLNHKHFNGIKDKLSDFDFYENYQLNHHRSSLYSKYDGNSFLQNKRVKSPERSNNFNFNRNVIELSFKVRNNIASSEKSFKNSKLYEFRRNNENENENIFNDEVADTSLLDLNAKKDIPNGAVKKDKVIEIFINFKHDKKEDITIPLNINKNNLVSLLKELILEKLKQRDDVSLQSLSVENLILIKHTTLMKDTKLISEYNILNGDTLILAVSKEDEEDEEYFNIRGAIHKHCKKAKIHFKHINKNQVAPIESLPILSKEGYKTSPDFKVICRMTLEELQNVGNFSIWNRFGKIEWKEKVDLSELDLDDIVEINKYYLNLYQGKTKKPPKGQKLNKPAIFTIANIMPEKELKSEKDKKEFDQLLRNTVKEQGGEFIGYDYDNYELVFECSELK